jgi:hypothetical protein
VRANSYRKVRFQKCISQSATRAREQIGSPVLPIQNPQASLDHLNPPECCHTWYLCIHKQKTHGINLPTLSTCQCTIISFHFSRNECLVSSETTTLYHTLQTGSLRTIPFPGRLELHHTSRLPSHNDEQQTPTNVCLKGVGRFVPVNRVFAMQVFQSFKNLASVCADYHLIKNLELLQDGLKWSHFH